MKNLIEEKRIYVVVPGTIQVPDGKGKKTVVQPAGRQIAQACHVVSRLRHGQPSKDPIFKAYTTIILQARDSAEMHHVWLLLHKNLLRKKKPAPVGFWDTNPEYGAGSWPTAMAAFATKKEVVGILDYLPMWGAQ
jgi:hypothetical protein